MKKFLTIIAFSFFCMSSISLPVFASCEDKPATDCPTNGEKPSPVSQGSSGDGTQTIGTTSTETGKSKIDLYAPFAARSSAGDIKCKRPASPEEINGKKVLPGDGGYMYDPYDSTCESKGGVRVQRIITDRSSQSIMGAYLGLVFRYALGLGVGASVLMVVFGGIKMITAFGDSNAEGDAKNFIIQGGAGLAILVLAATILRIINPNFFSFY